MIEFPRVWAATDLGEHRPTNSTYAGWDYDTLPPLDPARLKGFAWAGDAAASDPDPEAAERLAAISALLPEGMGLPDAFIHYMSRPGLYALLDEVSTTACWTDLSGPYPSPVEDGARLVLFFRDQQDCLFWYLYLRPNGESFIAESSWAPDALYGDDGREDDDEPEYPPELSWTSPGIEEYTYRYWLECTIWYVLVRFHPGGELTDEGRAYLAHYGHPANG